MSSNYYKIILLKFLLHYLNSTLKKNSDSGSDLWFLVLQIHSWALVTTVATPRKRDNVVRPKSCHLSVCSKFFNLHLMVSIFCEAFIVWENIAKILWSQHANMPIGSGRKVQIREKRSGSWHPAVKYQLHQASIRVYSYIVGISWYGALWSVCGGSGGGPK